MNIDNPLFFILMLLAVALWFYTLYVIGTSHQMEIKDKVLWFIIVLLFTLVGCLIFLLLKPHQKKYI